MEEKTGRPIRPVISLPLETKNTLPTNTHKHNQETRHETGRNGTGRDGAQKKSLNYKWILIFAYIDCGNV